MFRKAECGTMNAELKIPMAEWKSLAVGFIFDLMLFVALSMAAVWLIAEN